MNKEKRFKSIFRSGEVNIDNEGIAVCPYCNGSGLNAEYELFNKFQSFIGMSGRAYCVKCYGKKQTDWIEIANGRNDEEMRELAAQHGEMGFLEIKNYLTFIYYGEICLYGEDKWFFYDHDLDQWKETEDPESEIWIDHFKAKKEMLYWFEKFFHDGYITEIYLNLHDLMRSIYNSDIDYEYAAKIKSYILNSTEMTVEELLQVRESLSILGYAMDDLNDIEINEDAKNHFAEDFEFTWDNLLEKFRLPRVHKYSKVPDGVLTFDFET